MNNINDFDILLILNHADKKFYRKVKTKIFTIKRTVVYMIN